MNWIKKNKNELIILLSILLLASFLRFYRLDEYMQFLGDQGRDALAIKGILVGHHFPAIGPPSSVGTIYLGPLYYYMMALSMAFFWLNPVAAAGMVALIGVATVFLIYYLSGKWFGSTAGLVAAFLYAISPVAINYSRFSWNPNPVPFFTLLAFLGIYQAHKSGNFLWFILSGISLAAVIQMHYLALILLPIFGLLWLNELKIYLKRKNNTSFFWWGTILTGFLFLLIMSPLLIFDLRHEYKNFHGLVNLFTGKDSGIKLSLADSFSRLPEVFVNNFTGRYVGGNNTLLAEIISLLIFIPILRRLYLYYKHKHMSWVIFALTSWLVLGFLGLMLYQGDIYDHYLAFLSPIPFILLGGLAQLVWNLKKFNNFGIVILFVTISILAYFNLVNNPLMSPPNRQLQKTQAVDQFVIKQANNKPFNFALLSENNYDSAYQFYLEQFGHKPQTVPDQKTEQLFVVCEDPICKPVGHPKYEIAAFGWTKLEWENEVAGVKVFKLLPNPIQSNR